MPKSPKYYGVEQIFHQEFNQSKKIFFKENWEGGKRGVLLILVECSSQVGLRYGKYWIWIFFSLEIQYKL